MLPQERLKILFVDVAIRPVINLSKSFLVVELFAALNGLFLFFHNPAEGNLLLEETCKFCFNACAQRFSVWDHKVRALCDLSTECRLVAGHEELQVIIEMQ